MIEHTLRNVEGFFHPDYIKPFEWVIHFKIILYVYHFRAFKLRKQRITDEVSLSFATRLHLHCFL